MGLRGLAPLYGLSSQRCQFAGMSHQELFMRQLAGTLALLFPIGRAIIGGKAEGEHRMKAVPPLAISSDKVCFIIIKAREYDVKDVVTDPDSGSNGVDDGMISV